ncbi:type I pullulanase [Clostridiales bacterium]|nr:type I pullulanase [Clostridiales bacterium]
MMKRMLSLLTALLMLLAVIPVSAGAEEYTLPMEEGKNQIIFYWDAEDANLDNCDMWIWFPNADGRGYLFHPCEYGAKVVLNVPADVDKVGFIVRRDCSEPGGTSWGSAVKDYDGDRFANITGEVTEVYLKSADGHQYLSRDGGKTLYEELTFTLAAISGMNEIQYFINPAARLESMDQVRVTEGDRKLEVTGLSSLNNSVVTGKITLGEELDLSKIYTVEIEGYGAKDAVPTKVFDSPAFKERYTYEGDDLGAVLTETGTRFKVWAPTANRVRLKLYEAGNGGDAFDTIEMERGEQGVWSAETATGAGTYYTYLVNTSAGEQEAVDPYARAVGVNGDRGMVADLDATDPEGFAEDRYYDGINAYNEAVIWEVHVRDFSNKLASSQYPGKYLAFTEKGLKNSSGEAAGIDYLADLGVTHVHLQPVYDFATVDESKEGTGFNWGYDPKNYNAPEGSYSTDPFHGEVRIREFKQMVQALHENGMGVVMDVVYNHTYSADSCLNRIVPYYYYRYDGMGKLSNGSGCGNETASERPMMRKYIVDSVRYWAEEYHVDGFRFDLMALHDTDTMQAVEQAVHAVNPKAIIYGEGWTGGTTPLMEPLRASQANIRKVTASEGAIGAVSVFNDSIRDGLKGSVFDAKEKGYVSGNVSKGNAENVIFGLTGGIKSKAVSWHVKDNGVINYMSCHDNHTLFDRLLSSNPDDSLEARLRMNRFGISIIMIGKGTPFFLAGEELLRTKNGDSNSYNSGDEVNNIRWDELAAGSDTMAMRDFYRSLIAMRKANPFLTKAELTCTVGRENAIEAVYTEGEKTVAYALVNPSGSTFTQTLPEGNWTVLMQNETVSPEGGETVSGTVQVEGRSVLLVKAE